MHNLMLITLTMSTEATSLDVRSHAQSELLNDDSFCGEGGRFGSPLCDWFVIGGRWSGLLKETLLGDPYQAAFAARFPELAGGAFQSSLVDKHRAALNDLWHSFGGVGDSPVTRSGYDDLGCEDDAMLLDQSLYDRFLATYAGQADRIGRRSEFADLDFDEVHPSFIGRKWLVVVDYHN